MAGILTVQTIQGPTSGANANKIIIPAGQTLDASAGFVFPAGSVVQTSPMTRVSNLQITVNNSSAYTGIGNGLVATITPKQAGSLFRVVLNFVIQAPSSQYLATKIYTSVNGGTYTNTDSMNPASWTGGANSWETSHLDQIISATYSVGDTLYFQPFVYTYTVASPAYFGWGSGGDGSEVQIYAQEIAQ